MGKLCLMSLLREVGLEKFNNMVAEAQNQLLVENRWAKRGCFEQLFDTQIATLEDRGVPLHMSQTTLPHHRSPDSAPPC